MAYYETGTEFGPIPGAVKCPKCGGKATISSHNHSPQDERGNLFCVWMQAGWYCPNCNLVFCGLCQGGGTSVLDVEEWKEGQPCEVA